MKKRVTRVAIVCDEDCNWFVRRIMEVAHEVSLNTAPRCRHITTAVSDDDASARMRVARSLITLADAETAREDGALIRASFS